VHLGIITAILSFVGPRRGVVLTDLDFGTTDDMTPVTHSFVLSLTLGDSGATN
jgi:hypothetical protein